MTTVTSPTPTSTIQPTATIEPTATQSIQVKPWPGLHDGWMFFPPPAKIINVVYDSQGYIWAITGQGPDTSVSRWNIETGEYKQYTYLDGLPPHLHGITVFKDKVFVSSADGIVAYYSGDQWVQSRVAYIWNSFLSDFSNTGDRLWVADSSFLYVFDGQMWKLFSALPGVRDPSNFQIAESRDGSLWILRGYGSPVERYDGQNWKANDYPSGVHKIVTSQNGLLWFITSYGSAIAFDGTHWKPLVLPGNDFRPYVSNVLLSYDGSLLLITSQGTFTVDKGRPTKIEEPSDSSGKQLVAVTKAGWFFLNDQSVDMYNGLNWKYYKVPMSWNDQLVASLVSSNEVIGFAPDGSLYMFKSKNEFVEFDGMVMTGYQFQGDYNVDSPKIYIDQDRLIWYLTSNPELEYMIYRYLPGQTYPDRFELSNNVIDFTVTPNRETWALLDNGAIEKFSPSGSETKLLWSWHTMSGSNLGGNDYVVIADQIKIGGGISHYDIHPSHIASDAKSNVWVTTSNAGLFEYDGKEWMNYPGGPASTDSTALAIAPTSNFQLWVGSPNHLYRFDGIKWTDFYYEINPVSMVVAPDGSVWFADAVEGGVYRFDGVKWTYFTQANGLPAGQISKILVAPDGALWLFTSSNGWARYKPANRNGNGA